MYKAGRDRYGRKPNIPTKEGRRQGKKIREALYGPEPIKQPQAPARPKKLRTLLVDRIQRKRDIQMFINRRNHQRRVREARQSREPTQ